MTDFLEQLRSTTDDNNDSTDWLEANRVVEILTNMSAHEAMQGGMLPPFAQNINKDISEGQSGGINILKSIKMAQSYQEILQDDQDRDIRDERTVNFAIDTGIKRGSNVVISVVPENSNPHNESWDDRIKAKLRGSKVTFPHFSVQSISEPNEERYQIHETIGADFIQSFGTRPRIFMISGAVVNGKVSVQFGNQNRSMDWKNAFQRVYKRRFALKNCIKRREKIRIFSQSTVWDGYLVNMISQTSAGMQTLSQVTITFVMSDEVYSEENDENIPGFMNGDSMNTGFNMPVGDVFPTPNVNDYFSPDSSDEVEDMIFRKEEELSEIEKKIKSIAGDSHGSNIIQNLQDMDESDKSRVTLIDSRSVMAHDAILDSGYIESFTDKIGDGSNIPWEILNSVVESSKTSIEKINDLCIKYIDTKNEKENLESK